MSLRDEWFGLIWHFDLCWFFCLICIFVLGLDETEGSPVERATLAGHLDLISTFLSCAPLSHEVTCKILQEGHGLPGWLSQGHMFSCSVDMAVFCKCFLQWLQYFHILLYGPYPSNYWDGFGSIWQFGRGHITGLHPSLAAKERGRVLQLCSRDSMAAADHKFDESWTYKELRFLVCFGRPPVFLR